MEKILFNGLCKVTSDGHTYRLINNKWVEKGKDTGENKYRRISLKVDGVSQSYPSHRLIAEAFIPNPGNKPMVNHINGHKNDNRVENLEWCTAQENSIHAYKTGLHHPVTGTRVHRDENYFSTEEMNKRMMWGISEVMEYLGVGRRKATEILSQENCPTIPREKGQTFLIPRKSFIKWVQGGMR